VQEHLYGFLEKEVARVERWNVIRLCRSTFTVPQPEESGWKQQCLWAPLVFATGVLLVGMTFVKHVLICSACTCHVQMQNNPPLPFTSLFHTHIHTHTCACHCCQIALATMLTPPQPGEPSYEQDRNERLSEVASLRRRAHMVTDAFNSLEGMTCTFTEGAMYSFPQVCVWVGVGVGVGESGCVGGW